MASSPLVLNKVSSLHLISTLKLTVIPDHPLLFCQSAYPYPPIHHLHQRYLLRAPEPGSDTKAKADTPAACATIILHLVTTYLHPHSTTPDAGQIPPQAHLRPAAPSIHTIDASISTEATSTESMSVLFLLMSPSHSTHPFQCPEHKRP